METWSPRSASVVRSNGSVAVPVLDSRPRWLRPPNGCRHRDGPGAGRRRGLSSNRRGDRAPEGRSRMSMRLGVDTGGTFTDVVTGTGAIAKVSSTADDPARAVAQGVAAVSDTKPALLAHGTTV